MNISLCIQNSQRKSFTDIRRYHLGGEKWGRYSFLGCDPKRRIFCQKGKVKIQGQEEAYETTEKPLEAVRKLMKKYKAPVLPDYPPFTGGLVGY
ncbi:MAG TPA: hypothetical protein IAA00_05015, partial [Candidatus Blautia ornithocaccae]|nr:hypothetical protein [Candidatus Blautia ornithocaccae]